MKLIMVNSLLLAESTLVSKKWVSPDFVSGDHSYAFIFNPDGRLDILPDTIHAEVIEHNIRYYVNEYGIDEPPDYSEYDDEEFQSVYYDYLYNVRNIIETTALVGRVGRIGKKQRIVVSLWNDRMPVINSLLPQCLHALDLEGVINSNPLVSIQGAGTFKDVHGDVTAANVPKSNERKEATHNLQGARKIAAQKALGLLPGEGELPMDAPMTAAMKKHGFLNPGQKWWAMHSESKVR